VEAAAAADDLSIVNAFVTGPLHPGMRRCVGTVLSLSEPEGLISGPRSTIPSDTRTQYLVLVDFLYFICRRRRWADNIRTDLQEVGCLYMDWIGLAQDTDRWRTLVSAVMNLRVP